jgi:hypothetical protein
VHHHELVLLRPHRLVTVLRTRCIHAATGGKRCGHIPAVSGCPMVENTNYLWYSVQWARTSVTHCHPCYLLLGAPPPLSFYTSLSLLLLCTTTANACHATGGTMDTAFEWVIQNGGIDTESHYRYLASQGQCNIANEERHVVTIQGYRDGAPMNLEPFFPDLCLE